MSDRLAKDYEEFKKNKPLGGIGGPINGDLKHWEVTIPGPPNTPFEGGRFRIEIILDDNYPNSTPKCRFLTKVFHPNISFSSGSI
jgi:ubiquitin-protein ligase